MSNARNAAKQAIVDAFSNQNQRLRKALIHDLTAAGHSRTTVRRAIADMLEDGSLTTTGKPGKSQTHAMLEIVRPTDDPHMPEDAEHPAPEEKTVEPKQAKPKKARKPKAKKEKKAADTPVHVEYVEIAGEKQEVVIDGKRTSRPGALNAFRGIMHEVDEIRREDLLQQMVVAFGPKARWATQNYIALAKKGNLKDCPVVEEQDGVLRPVR